ncbi:MAG: hypothetical protein FRC54_04010 [bacterium LCO1.1]|uniref:Mutator family transposase n=1 Tax=Candidatus Weimeria bifida TaxID=2599074 RepID=A0A6N7IXP8_9FIRM|nr:hypothetical protein [Candidatus Weimeria bifida]
MYEAQETAIYTMVLRTTPAAKPLWLQPWRNGVSGVSTRKVARVVETLCGTSISKSAVSDVCKDLDQEVEAFATGRSKVITRSSQSMLRISRYVRTAGLSRKR